MEMLIICAISALCIFGAYMAGLYQGDKQKNAEIRRLHQDLLQKQIDYEALENLSAECIIEAKLRNDFEAGCG